MNLATFAFKDAPVRIVDQDGNPWFVAKDVCRVLGISKYRDAITRLDDDERGSVKLDTLGGKQNVTIINESGLYALIVRSNKAEAKTFRKWVTSEVLPAIRRTGKYDSGTDSITAALEKYVASNFKGKLADALLAKVTPRGQYGEIGKNGQPKTGFRASCWVSHRSRQNEAVRILGLLMQLELFADNQPLIKSI